MYFGPQSIFLALEVEFESGLSAAEVTSAVDRIEKSIGRKYPKIERIFIEAESYAVVEKDHARLHIQLDFTYALDPRTSSLPAQ